MEAAILKGRGIIDWHWYKVRWSLYRLLNFNMADKDDKQDPLSFFAAGDDSSSSDSENDDENNQVSKNKSKNDDNDDGSLTKVSKLPSPQMLFATIGKPKFLKTNQEEAIIDWDKLSTQYNPAIIAASPVVSLEEREKDERYTDATIASSGTKYGKELTDIQKHILLHGKRGSDIRLMTHTESSKKEQGTSDVDVIIPDSI